MRKLIFHIIWIFFIFQVTHIAADDFDRLEKLKKISQKKWLRIANGKEPWPEEIFPISHWSEEEKNKLPSSLWNKISEYERTWPEYISNEMNLFKKEFGDRYKNIYDLYLHEQSEMLKPGFSTPKHPVIKRKTLRRLIDVAHLHAKYFKNIVGTTTKNIRLFSYRMGRLRVIPFDVIEFTSTDRVVLTDGPEANPDDGDGIFNGNDRLFFMAADAGHKLSVEYIAKIYPTVKKIQEIEISFEKDDEKGWVYAVEIKTSEPGISPFDYTVFNPELSIIYTPFSYNQCEPRYFKGKIRSTLKLSTWCTAPNLGGIPFDVHQRLRVRIKLKYILGSTRDNEDELDVIWRAWFQGKVVNFIRAVFEVSTPLGIGAPIVFDDAIVTSFSVYNYINWYTSFDPSIIMKHLDVIVGEEHNKRALKYKDMLEIQHLSSNDRKWYKVDGQTPEEEKQRNMDYAPWHLFVNLQKNTSCMRTYYNKSLTEYGRRTLDWRDDEKNFGTYDNHLILGNFKKRIQNFCVEWNAVPFFINRHSSKYNWKNLDIVLKRIDKPLSYKFTNGEKITPGKFVHIPNIKIDNEIYDL